MNSSDPQLLKGAFSTLLRLFDKVVLRTNVGNTVGTVCRPFQVASIQSEAAYGRQMTGEGPSYQNRQKGRVQCREYGEEMAAGSLVGNSMKQHGRVAEERWIWKNLSAREEPRTYRIAFPSKGGLAELFGGGMPRASDDEDGDAGTFYTPACPGNHGHCRGRKPPPPMVRPMRHVGPMFYTERKAPHHCTVHQGSGAEEAAVSGGIIGGENGEGL